jgi:hypothetical protein
MNVELLLLYSDSSVTPMAGDPAMAIAAPYLWPGIPPEGIPPAAAEHVLSRAPVRRPGQAGLLRSDSGQFTKTCGLPCTLVSFTGPKSAVKCPDFGQALGPDLRLNGWLLKEIV